MANLNTTRDATLEDGGEGKTRREAVRDGARLIAGVSIGAQVMAATGAETAVARNLRGFARAAKDKPGYGPLVKAGPFSIPRGFRIVEFGAAGFKMGDGLETPKNHDGTAAFADGRGRVRLIRNHENSGLGKALGKRRAYDRAATGGVTSTRFDTKTGRYLDSALVLNGTDNNCNGGPTPWRSWLTCEESTVGPRKGWEKDHGYVFEIPSDARGPVEPVPIKAMGRFLHEACALDPRSGIVYMTEDNGPDGFYRYLPNNRRKLHRGGKLQMLAVEGRSNYNTARGQKVGKKLRCEWVTIDDPDPVDAEQRPDSVYMQGVRKGGARFMGLEGASWGNGSAYFTASEAGDANRGQVWRYTPGKDLRHGVLTLLFESTDRKILDQPDSMVVSPRGGVVLCEDGDGDINGGTNFLRCLTPKGTLDTFMRNDTPLNLERYEGEPKGTFGRSEWSGVCYSPDGKWLFVHIQIPGVTYAITGPWEKGWL